MAASLRICVLFAFLFLTFTVKIFTEPEQFLPCEGALRSTAWPYVTHGVVNGSPTGITPSFMLASHTTSLPAANSVFNHVLV